MYDNKALLTIAEACEYLSMSKTKMYEFIKEHERTFVIEIGKRKYLHKGLLDKWLMGQVKRRQSRDLQKCQTQKTRIYTLGFSFEKRYVVTVI